VAHNHRSRLRYRGIEIYRHKNCPYKVVTAAASAKGDALLVQVFTQDTNYGILVVHAPHARKVTNQGYQMYWLRLWAKVRRQIDTRRVIMVGDVNSAFMVGDRKKQRPTDTVYRRICATLGLKDLRQLVTLPEDTWSCVMGGGSRIDTAAVTEESSIRISDATYWKSTLMSDHHYPLLVRYQVPGIRVAKPETDCVPRLKESHMPPIQLSVSQCHQYALAVRERQHTGDPVTDSRGYIKRLQLAMYKWAEETNRLKVRTFDGGGLEERPKEETKDDIKAAPMAHSGEMLPPVDEFMASLRLQLCKPQASERELKTELTRIARQITRETTATADRNKKRERGEGNAQGRSAEAWGYIRRSLRKHRPKMENVELDGKVLINDREVLARI
jgi:hypothetical protein